MRLFRKGNRSKSYKEALIAVSEDELDKCFNNNDSKAKKFTAGESIDSKDSQRASPKNTNTMNQNERDSLPKRHNSSSDFLIAVFNKDNENIKIKQNDNIAGSNYSINKLFSVIIQTPAYSKKEEYTKEKIIIPSLKDSDRSPDSSAETARKNDKRSTNERLDELLINSSIPAKKQNEFVTSMPNKKRSSLSRFSSIFRNKNDKGKEKKEKKKKKKVGFFDKLRTKDKFE